MQSFYPSSIPWHIGPTKPSKHTFMKLFTLKFSTMWTCKSLFCYNFPHMLKPYPLTEMSGDGVFAGDIGDHKKILQTADTHYNRVRVRREDGNS